MKKRLDRVWMYRVFKYQGKYYVGIKKHRNHVACINLSDEEPASISYEAEVEPVKMSELV